MNKQNIGDADSKNKVKYQQHGQSAYSKTNVKNLAFAESAVDSEEDIMQSFSDCQNMKLSGALHNYSDTEIQQKQITINVRKVKNDGNLNTLSNNSSTLQNFNSQKHKSIKYGSSQKNSYVSKDSSKKYESLHQRTKKTYLNFQTPPNDPLCPTQRESFNISQIKFLKNYFRYSCLQSSNSPKYSTFDEVKIMMQMMGLNEWMRLCKYLQVYEFFAEARNIAKTISTIFKRYENKQKKIDFQAFCKSFGVLIEAMYKYMQQNYTKLNKIIIKKYLGIYSDKEHFVKLQLMGINCSSIKQRNNESSTKLTKVTYQKRLQTKSLHTQNQQNNNSHYTQKVQSIYQRNKLKYNNDLMSEKTNENIIKKQAKIYRKRQDRIRSRLLKNLGINNLHELLPDVEIKQNFQVITQQDDRFLKEYLKRKRQVKQGILRRLQSKYQKNKLISHPKSHKKTVKQFTKKPNFFVL